MAIIEFLLNVSGAVLLLLFAVRQVRTGIERAHGASFRRMITKRQNLLGASSSGLVLAAILQSSAAVGLLVAGFATGNLLGFPIALATILGADLGSALVIQVLVFRLEWLVPLLLTIGGLLFIKAEARQFRQYGRILMGIAFILISLQFLREAVGPIRDSGFLPAIAQYLANDFLTAYLIGAALAVVMHSSVATILTCVTLVQVGSIPVEAGLSLVLGANFGSAFIPVWLSRTFDIVGRRPIFANFILRGLWSFIFLLVINLAPYIWPNNISIPDAQILILAHILFNTSLVVLCLPFCRIFEPMFNLLFPDHSNKSEKNPATEYQSCLDPDDMPHPQRALTNLKRELLHMMNLIDRMFAPTIDMFSGNEVARGRMLKNMDKDVNACFYGIRDYVSGLPLDNYSKSEAKQARELLEFAIRLETAGDVLAKRVGVLADEAQAEKCAFSSEGRQELDHMHDLITNNLRLANNVLISDDLECARLLSLEKSEVKRYERESRKRHLKRLQSGLSESIASSNVHLELLRAFREFNGHISAVAYPILYKHGQLLETRLIDEMQTDPKMEHAN